MKGENMEQLKIWMTDKHIRFIRESAALKKISFDEMIRQIIESNIHNSRLTEIKRLKGDSE